MTVTVSPIRAPQLISEPGRFPRFLGRVSGPIAPAQVAPLHFPIGPHPRHPDGAVVVYEGNVDVNEQRVFARVVSSQGVLGPEIIILAPAEAAHASVASMSYEHPGLTDHFVVVYRTNQGHIFAEFYNNDSSSWLPRTMIAGGGLIPASSSGFLGVIERLFSRRVWRSQLAPAVAINPFYEPGPGFTVVWSSGEEHGGFFSRWLNQSGTAYKIYDLSSKLYEFAFPGTTSQSKGSFNACAHITQIKDGVHVRVYQTDNGDIYVGVSSIYPLGGNGTDFGSYKVGFGDYPSTARLDWSSYVSSDIGRTESVSAVVVWHDPRRNEIKFSFIGYSGYPPWPVQVATEKVANEIESSSLGRPAVAMLASPYSHIGDRFVIVWEDLASRIKARVFNPKGDPATSEFIIYDASPAAAPSVIGNDSGFYVVWMDHEGDTDAPLWAIKGQAWQVVEA